MLTLSQSPEFKIKTYKSFDIQDFKFCMKLSEESNCTQKKTSYASVHDNDPREENITYYGVIKDIIELFQ